MHEPSRSRAPLSPLPNLPGGSATSDIPPPHRREIRSARFPHGLPDRCDSTVVEAFDDSWLLLERTDDGYRELGVAEDYLSARRWLMEEDPGTT
jgi:hypothetical protein